MVFFFFPLYLYPPLFFFNKGEISSWKEFLIKERISSIGKIKQDLESLKVFFIDLINKLYTPLFFCIIRSLAFFLLLINNQKEKVEKKVKKNQDGKPPHPPTSYLCKKKKKICSPLPSTLRLMGRLKSRIVRRRTIYPLLKGSLKY